MEKDSIEKVQEFLDSLERLGDQLQAAENQQKFFISRMLELKKENLTDSEEYASLDNRSKALQAMIDKWRPIYLERLEMVKEVRDKKRKK